jgi:hypothetical protein
MHQAVMLFAHNRIMLQPYLSGSISICNNFGVNKAVYVEQIDVTY